MSKTSFIITLILTVLFSIYFLVNPAIDLHIAHHFYLLGNTFYLGHFQWPEYVRETENIVIDVFAGIIFCLLLFKVIKPNSKISAKFLIYCLVVYTLVPGLLVNSILKDNFHRPRPRQVLQFGGDMVFKRPFSTTGECTTNCSFVCGDAAAMFAFWLFLPFVGRRRKFLYGSLVALVGGFYGYIRIGQGAHFFSDVIFAGLLSYLAIWLLYWFFYTYDPRWLRESVIENVFVRGHRVLVGGREGV